MGIFSRKNVSKVNIRRRVAISAIFSAFVLFILTTPILGVVGDLLRAPEPLENIQIIRTADSIQVSWDFSKDSDVKEYQLEIEGSSVKVGKNINTYTFSTIDPAKDYRITISTTDITNRKTSVSKDLPVLTDQSEVYFINNTPIEENKAMQILLRTVVVGFFILAFSLWITLFDFSTLKHITISLYPAIVLIPYSFITLSFLYSETQAFSKFLLSFLFSIIFGFVSYLLLLTMNILNASLTASLPLEQAAKAAQFVFSLISSYLILILFFGAEFTILEKLLFVMPFIFYFSFSAILMLKDINFDQVMVRTISITITMMLAILVLSMWPVNYVFAMISSAVIFYILLSITLEVRYKITKSIWSEYIILLLLILVLLISNSTWGIKGSLI